MDISPYLPPSELPASPQRHWVPAPRVAGARGGLAARPSPRCRAILAETQRQSCLGWRRCSSGCRRNTITIASTNGIATYEWTRGFSSGPCAAEGSVLFQSANKTASTVNLVRLACPSQQKSSGETGKPLEFAQARKKARRNDVDIRLLTTAVQHFSEDRVVVHTS